MPCDAIAVAKGQVPLNLARELDGLETAAVAQALLALLRQGFAHLGRPELIHLLYSGGHRFEQRRRRDALSGPSLLPNCLLHANGAARERVCCAGLP